jgi:hypothetical protein
MSCLQQHSHANNATESVELYVNRVCSRLRGLQRCDGVASTYTLSSAEQLSALSFLSKVLRSFLRWFLVGMIWGYH